MLKWTVSFITVMCFFISAPWLPFCERSRFDSIFALVKWSLWGRFNGMENVFLSIPSDILKLFIFGRFGTRSDGKFEDFALRKNVQKKSFFIVFKHQLLFYFILFSLVFVFTQLFVIHLFRAASFWFFFLSSVRFFFWFIFFSKVFPFLRLCDGADWCWVGSKRWC